MVWDYAESEPTFLIRTRAEASLGQINWVAKAIGYATRSERTWHRLSGRMQGKVDRQMTAAEEIGLRIPCDINRSALLRQHWLCRLIGLFLCLAYAGMLRDRFLPELFALPYRFT